MLSHSAMSWGIISACFLRFSSSWENKFCCQFIKSQEILSDWSFVDCFKSNRAQVYYSNFFPVFYLFFSVVLDTNSLFICEGRVSFENAYTTNLIAEF